MISHDSFVRDHFFLVFLGFSHFQSIPSSWPAIGRRQCRIPHRIDGWGVSQIRLNVIRNSHSGGKNRGRLFDPVSSPPSFPSTKTQSRRPVFRSPTIWTQISPEPGCPWI
jgi:hypothetical protein